MRLNSNCVEIGIHVKSIKASLKCDMNDRINLIILKEKQNSHIFGTITKTFT